MQSIPILSIQATGQLMSVLEDYLDKSEASFAMVIDRGGAVLSQQGDLPTDTDVMILAALAAGSFAATKELALRVGEPEFTALHQQGRHWQIFLCSIDEDTVLTTIFGAQSTLGLVRFYSSAAVRGVSGILNAARAEQMAVPIFTEQDISVAQPVF
jgi:predicted regulator of Ras-like GTPase activity (Roadblock/LC7/MglB family)